MGKKSRERRERYQERVELSEIKEHFGFWHVIKRQAEYFENMITGVSMSEIMKHGNGSAAGWLMPKGAETALVVRADHIKDWCCQKFGIHYWDIWQSDRDKLELFNVAPQFPAMALEFTDVQIDFPEGGGVRVYKELCVYFYSNDMIDDFNDEDRQNEKIARWSISCWLYGRPAHDKDFRSLGTCIIVVSQHGKVNVIPGCENYKFDALYPALVTLQFLNCKNVELVDRKSSPRIQHLGEKHGIPVDDYKVLKVHNTRKVYQNGDTESDSADLDPKRLHIVRGNFATYTDEAPLFGKLTGTFWRPAHVRGDEQKGVLIKDYEIEVDSN